MAYGYGAVEATSILLELEWEIGGQPARAISKIYNIVPKESNKTATVDDRVARVAAKQVSQAGGFRRGAAQADRAPDDIPWDRYIAASQCGQWQREGLTGHRVVSSHEHQVVG